MTRFRRIFLMVASLALVVGLGVATLPSSAVAGPTTPLFTECPAVGHDSGCHELITISASGVASVATDSSQPAIDNQEDTLVGVVNDSNALVSGVALSGTDIFGFDGDGLCSAAGACTSPTQYGPTGYEGPGTSFTTGSPDGGTVNLTGGGLAPGAHTYFTLEKSPFTVSSVALLPDITLSADPLSGVEGQAVSGAVASFTDGPSDAAPASFAASIAWGDGVTTSGLVTQTGSGTPYVVTASHTYAEEGSYTPTVTVTDTSLPLNTAQATGTAVIADAPITAAPTTIADQTTNTGFTVPVATFTATRRPR